MTHRDRAGEPPEGVRKPRAMPRRTRGFLPARRKADTISMGLYHRSLVLLPAQVQQHRAAIGLDPFAHDGLPNVSLIPRIGDKGP